MIRHPRTRATGGSGGGNQRRMVRRWSGLRPDVVPDAEPHVPPGVSCVVSARASVT
ncbi:hypothetical protein FRACA_550014 [Frankia canadensis]|uniref:Uncharacterized protein n=1 Tax=Frankia canadensis TaxID=1836972 RepID=A0A2I2KYY3_9ACTN|nr:hypothetical protein FRACA_550014 [Frankia canadensis]SOU58149.1 hypothetical protein FRACA_550014 [Frankia canadensis]